MKLTRRKFIKLLGTTSISAVTNHLAFSAQTNSNLTELKVAYPPTMAALPLVKGVQRKFFLEEDGVKPFANQGIELTLIPSKGSSDAARLVSGGRADCSITGLSSSLYAIRGRRNLKISASVFDPNESGRYFGLVTSNLYEISSLADLVENWLDSSARKSIILSLRRDDHFATDKLIKTEGYEANDKVYYVDQEDIISRLYGLLNGNFVSTVLPEPVLTLALKNPEFKAHQASLISDYANVTLPPFVLAFNRKLLEKNTELVNRFYKGWEIALKETNDSSNLQLLGLTTKILSETLPSLQNAIEDVEFTEEFANLFDIPHFSRPKPLDRSIFDSVMDWTISKGFLKNKIPFQQAYEASSAVLADKSK